MYRIEEVKKKMFHPVLFYRIKQGRNFIVARETQTREQTIRRFKRNKENRNEEGVLTELCFFTAH